MKLTNTSQYDTTEVKRLVAFGAKGVRMTGVAVRVQDGPRSGRANAVSGIVIKVGRKESFPMNNMVYGWGRFSPWRGIDDPPTEGYDPDTWFDELRGFYFRADGRPSQIRSRPPVVHPYGGKRSPFIEVADWREGLVAMAAHEARHIWQFQYKRPLSEVDAERFAQKRLAAYRALLLA